MASSYLPKGNLFFLFLISISLFCFHSGFAEDDPGQRLAKAMLCFNNKFVYAGCEEAYRLNPSGNLNVPPDLTDLFCNGPCLRETQLVLNCVDEMLSNFIFDNRASIPQIRYALNAGCSYAKERGSFNLGEYFQGETSKAYKLQSLLTLCTFMAIGALVNLA